MPEGMTLIVGLIGSRAAWSSHARHPIARHPIARHPVPRHSRRESTHSAQSPRSVSFPQGIYLLRAVIPQHDSLVVAFPTF